MARHRKTTERELARLYALRKPAPLAPNEAIAQAGNLAERTVRSKEGVLQYLYRSLVDDTNRREEIAAIAARRRDELLNAHRVAAEAHAVRQREIDSEIRTLEANITRISEVVEVEVQQFLDESKIPEPTKSKDVRLVRAYFAGLVSHDRTALASSQSR